MKIPTEAYNSVSKFWEKVYSCNCLKINQSLTGYS